MHAFHFSMLWTVIVASWDLCAALAGGWVFSIEPGASTSDIYRGAGMFAMAVTALFGIGTIL